MIPIKDYQSSGVFPVITITVIIITAAVFLMELFSPDIEKFIYSWSLVPNRINFKDIASLYSFITSIFLHAGFVHIISNMWFLAIFGDNVEGALGKMKYLFFYLTGGVFAGLVQYFFMAGASIPSLGASGAVAAVLGFYFVRFPHHTVKTLVPFFYLVILDLPSQFILGYWFLMQFLNGAASLAVQTAVTGGVAWWAHIGGFLYGVFMARFIFKGKYQYV